MPLRKYPYEAFVTMVIASILFDDIEKIELDEYEITLKVGETYEIDAKFFPIYAIHGQVYYKSADKDIAKADRNGLVTAKSVGETMIAVTTERGGIAKLIVNVVE